MTDGPHRLWSWTRLSTLLRCGKLFEFRYIDKKNKFTRTLPLIVGTAAHEVNHRNLQRKVETGKLLDPEAIRDIAADHAKSAIDREAGDWTKKQAGKAVDETISIARGYHFDLATKLDPIKVEHKWMMEVKGRPFKFQGRTDIQERDRTIRDTKTTGTNMGQTDCDQSDQLTMYALAATAEDGATPPRVALDVIKRKTGANGVRTFYSTRDKRDFKALVGKAQIGFDMVEAGVFPPAAPNDFLCSERWCEAWEDCPFGQRGRSKPKI